MPTFTVTTASDTVNAGDGVLSLREAVTLANNTAAADTINFSAGLDGQILTLAGGELDINGSLTIDGDQNNDGTRVTLSGGGESGIIHTFGFATDLTVNDLSLVKALSSPPVVHLISRRP